METYAPIFIVEIAGEPLHKDISAHVEEFSYEECDEKMDELRIKIIDAELEWIDNPQLQEDKEIKARWGYLGKLSDIRTCTIKELEYEFPDTGLPSISIVAVDKGHKLTGRASRECWNNKTVRDVVQSIATKHNLSPVIRINSDTVREYFSQGGKSDMQFLKELAAEMDCRMYVQNDELHFETIKNEPSSVTLRFREDQDGYLVNFSITSSTEEGKGAETASEVAGMDPLKKQPFKETLPGDKVDLTEGKVLSETPLQSKSDETGRASPSPSHTQAQGRREAASKSKQTPVKAIEARCETVGIPHLQAKGSITIENIGRKFSGVWRIKAVRHCLSRSGYRCELTLVKNDTSKGGTGSRARQVSSSGGVGRPKQQPSPDNRGVVVNVNDGSYR